MTDISSFLREPLVYWENTVNAMAD